jgi:anaerobic selenocysteine-containing dehydrogenase
MAVDQILTEDPYPIKAAWIQTTNILGGQAADTRKHYEALKKLEFNVVVDTFHNPTSMAVADIVLPAASFPEKESFRSWWAPLSVVVPAIKVGECKSDWEINLELARRFNPQAIQYKSVKELIDDRLPNNTASECAVQQNEMTSCTCVEITRPDFSRQNALLLNVHLNALDQGL